MTLLALLLVACGSKDDTGGETGADTADTADSGETGETGETGDSGDTGTPAGGALGDQAVTFVGAPSDAAGSSLLLPGDVDGDGASDVVVGAYYGNRACLFRGPVPAGAHALDDADACFEGAGTYDFTAYALADAGDADGDGRMDLLVGAVGNADMGANAGKVYLLRWEEGALAPYATWVGEATGDYAGISLAHAGDLTGDGEADLLVGASGGGTGGGEAYLVPGPVVPGDHHLGDLAYSFLGSPKGAVAPPHGGTGTGDMVGDAMAAPGDMSGDGIDDLVLGAGGNGTSGTSAGLVVVFLGPVVEGQHSIYEADLLMYGAVAGSFTGSPVASDGDLTGDGLADVLVASDGVGTGTVYLLPGGFSAGSTTVASCPTSFVGEGDADQAGAALAAPGDLTGDGVEDVAIGAPGNDRTDTDAGTVYVMAGPFAAGALPMSGAALILPGEKLADSAARVIAGGGDGDGDGVLDLLVGAVYNDDGGAFSGKAYLVPGR